MTKTVSYELHVKQQKLSRQQDDGLFTVTIHALVPKLYSLGRVVLLACVAPSESRIRLCCPPQCWPSVESIDDEKVLLFLLFSFVERDFSFWWVLFFPGVHENLKVNCFLFFSWR